MDREGWLNILSREAKKDQNMMLSNSWPYIEIKKPMKLNNLRLS